MCQQLLCGIARRHMAPTRVLTSPCLLRAPLDAVASPPPTPTLLVLLLGSSKAKPRLRASATSHVGSQLAATDGACEIGRTNPRPPWLPIPAVAKFSGSDAPQGLSREAIAAALAARLAASLAMFVPQDAQMSELLRAKSLPRAVSPLRSQ